MMGSLLVPDDLPASRSSRPSGSTLRRGVGPLPDGSLSACTPPLRAWVVGGSLRRWCAASHVPPEALGRVPPSGPSRAPVPRREPPALSSFKTRRPGPLPDRRGQFALSALELREPFLLGLHGVGVISSVSGSLAVLGPCCYELRDYADACLTTLILWFKTGEQLTWRRFQLLAELQQSGS